MNLETFFEKFDLFANLPDAVAKMRELVIQLAVQGKLVPQDPSDEPAEELLIRIQQTKNERIKRREMKRVSIAPDPSNDSLEQLPPGWLWTRLGNAFDVRDGTHDTPKYCDEGYPLITSKNIYSGSLCFEGASFISEEDHQQISERSKVGRGDILFAMIGSIGNPVIVETDREFSIKNVALFKYYSLADSEPRFLLLYLKHASEEMKAKSAGGVQSFVSLGFLRNYLFTLPPLAEQKRIVAKVDELMALCDRLEAQQQEGETRHASLARASLVRFAEAPTPANLNFLFHKSYDISPADLRKTILTLAVQGKLVPQDPSDEPAEELLAKLRMEESGENNRRRKADQLPEITPDGIPFDLPPGWAWANLGSIGETNIGLTYSPQAISDVGIPVLRSSNIQNGKLDFADLVRVRCEPKQRVMVQDGDLLICARNGSRALVGKVALIENLAEPAAFGAFMAIFRSRLNRYLYHFICSPLFRRMIDDVNTTTINQITQNNLRTTFAPIPPLAEQRRIVSKVDQLMTLVDELEAQLAASRTTGEKLLTALVAELTTGKESPAAA